MTTEPGGAICESEGSQKRWRGPSCNRWYGLYLILYWGGRQMHLWKWRDASEHLGLRSGTRIHPEMWCAALLILHKKKISCIIVYTWEPGTGQSSHTAFPRLIHHYPLAQEGSLPSPHCLEGQAYRWKFPFCLQATSGNRPASLRTLADLCTFCDVLGIPEVIVGPVQCFPATRTLDPNSPRCDTMFPKE